MRAVLKYHVFSICTLAGFFTVGLVMGGVFSGIALVLTVLPLAAILFLLEIYIGARLYKERRWRGDKSHRMYHPW